MLEGPVRLIPHNSLWLMLLEVPKPVEIPVSLRLPLEMQLLLENILPAASSRSLGGAGD